MILSCGSWQCGRCVSKNFYYSIFLMLYLNNLLIRMFWILIYLLVSDEIDNWGLTFKFYASQESIKPSSQVKFEILKLVLTFIFFFHTISPFKIPKFISSKLPINHDHHAYVYYILYPYHFSFSGRYSPARNISISVFRIQKQDNLIMIIQDDLDFYI